MKKRVNILVALIAAGSIGYVAWNYFQKPGTPNGISFADFERHVQQGQVESVVLDGNTAVGQFKATSPAKGSFRTLLTRESAGQTVANQLPLDQMELAHELVRQGIKVKVIPSRWSLITTIILGILVYALWKAQLTHFARSLVAGAFYVAILWYLHSQYPLPGEVRGFYTLSAMRFKLFDSGPIPLFILGTFFAGLHYLIVILSIKFMPLANADLVEQSLIAVAKQGDTDALEEALRKQARQQGLGYYGARIARLLERFRSDQDLAAVIALKNDLLEIDEEEFANTFVGVTWAELALPLWGFLGTVVGVGEAIYNISNGAALIFKGGAGSQGQDVLAHFNRGFQGMGVAFDTTFLGLGGVIIIGVLHTSLKKAFAARLAKARTLLAEIVEKFPTSDGGRIDAVPGGILATLMTGMSVNIAGLTDRMDELEHAVLKSDRGATAFRERLRYMAERVILEDSDYQKIRDVLFVPVVEFAEVGETTSGEIKEYITKQLGHEKWHIACFSFPSLPSPTGLAVIRDHAKNADRLLTVGMGHKPSGLLETADRFSRVYADSGGRQCLGVSETGTLVSAKLDGAYAPTTVATKLQPDEPVLQAGNAKDSFTLLIRRQAMARNVLILASGEEPKPLGQLPPQRDWTIYRANPSTSPGFFVAGPTLGAADRWSLLRCSIQESRRGEAADPDRSLRADTIDLPSTLKVKDIVLMGSEQLLILDDIGDVHYWQPSLSSPRKLSHAKWQRDPQCAIRAGSHGWIAVVAKARLTMWRIGYGGVLMPYDRLLNGFDVRAIDAATLQTTADGRHLVALASTKGKMLFAWEFPRYAADEL